MYLNKAILIGNLTRDPELTTTTSGYKVCKFGMATNRVWKDKNGARQESVDYHNVVVFGRQAETVAQYMKKGSSILVEGRMQTTRPRERKNIALKSSPIAPNLVRKGEARDRLVLQVCLKIKAQAVKVKKSTP